MDFSAQLDALQQRVAAAKSAVQAAATESREQLRQRIDQTRVDIHLAVEDAQQRAGALSRSRRNQVTRRNQMMRRWNGGGTHGDHS